MVTETSIISSNVYFILKIMQHLVCILKKKLHTYVLVFYVTFSEKCIVIGILKEYFHSMIFLGKKGDLQDSGKPRNSGKNPDDQTFRYCGVLLYINQKIGTHVTDFFIS